MCLYKKVIYQYISKKYYIICFVKNEKYRNYEDLLSKYTTDNNYFSIKE